MAVIVIIIDISIIVVVLIECVTADLVNVCFSVIII